ncbi:MAG: quinone-dependent dihydroorotate dehydrogenase [Acetobacter fabarum]|uniref:quinone-dependent dihydroorotate dehydrogenase n=1 Tax=Acetobacter fabarum TaxID=483199 RepID=UPI00242D13CA|nr:quinone-dependent dihydroorotate dehydrogenase [Acetobacter fabarum]MCH4025696.1 quinone-dependent dihydroorotate dehydrogenase [Acetobacter fabarum]MCH4054652.1 quinone-dependent dihydroorotate dehydrogenase [Acetobacter fabarum]MCH4086445.1 quinone-dependent dihydroorotate dehydrogenase [Acetobacter fabarum]MCH4128507.1 quinone-dependent dihydroorotate dehydrogenase [Acetobacter fabarum]MCH4138320.1 quinone-dependent dihydroorotate dehydrogenase [Acetobacter fabarum]
MSVLASLSLPLVRKLDPEKAHELAIDALTLGISVPFKRPEDDPALATRALGMRFSNPIGIAAGFDKNARVLRPLARLGFGFVEAGTVTPRPQPGNPKPRLFRLEEDRAVINRMGFNNQGIDRFAVRLARLTRPLPSGRAGGAGVPVGANIGINKTGADPERDYPALVARVKPYVNYIVLNVSSPNTPGLRGLQDAARLKGILDAIAARHPERPPLLVKLAPDLEDDAIAPIVEAAIQGGVQGLIINNTTLARPDSLRSPHKGESGGLSGRPLAARSTQMLRLVANIAAGRLALVSCGGIESGQDILDRIRLGADLVQVYTAFAYEGPALIARLKREMLQIMRAQGIETLDDVRGVDL